MAWLSDWTRRVILFLAVFCIVPSPIVTAGAKPGLSTSAQAALEAGIAHARAGQLREASEAMARAAELAPTSAEVWHNYGILNAQMGRLEEAVKQLTIFGLTFGRLSAIYVGAFFVIRPRPPESIN